MVKPLSVSKSHLNLSSYAGSQTLLELMDHCGVSAGASRVRVKRIKSGIPDADYIRLSLLLIATGHTDFESVREVRDESTLKHLLGIKRLPHANTLREYMGRLDDAAIMHLKRLLNVPLASATPLPDPIGMIPVDYDASVFVQHGMKKEQAEYAYNGEFGYQPLFGFIGRQGYCMDVSLRAGNHNGVVGTADELEKAFDRLPEAVAEQPLLFRFDAGFYSHDIVETIHALKKDFLIKAKLTAPLKRAIDALPEQAWTPDPSAGVDTAHAEFRYQPSGWKREERFVVRREIHYGDGLFPETRYFAFVTSLEREAGEVDACYRRRGQAENFIKEMQYDLGLECLPSGKFATNKAFLHLGALAYNLLVLLGELSQRDDKPKRNKIGRRTLGTIRRQYLIVAGYIRCHARTAQLMLSRSYTLFDEYMRLLQRIRSINSTTG